MPGLGKVEALRSALPRLSAFRRFGSARLRDGFTGWRPSDALGTEVNFVSSPHALPLTISKPTDVGAPFERLTRQLGSR